MQTAFISGHLDLTEEEFDLHYKPQIELAHSRGYSFVVGDARGADTMAQKLLAHLGAKVIVFHMFSKPRNLLGNFELRGGFNSDIARDEAMTLNSDYEIAWVRPGREKSGTQKNINRRKESRHE